jgi:hypothetical protein
VTKSGCVHNTEVYASTNPTDKEHNSAFNVANRLCQHMNKGHTPFLGEKYLRKAYIFVYPNFVLLHTKIKQADKFLFILKLSGTGDLMILISSHRMCKIFYHNQTLKLKIQDN